jgi:hypothetical protein
MNHTASKLRHDPGSTQGFTMNDWRCIYRPEDKCHLEVLKKIVAFIISGHVYPPIGI